MGEEVVPLGPLMEVEVEGAVPLPLVWESLIAIVCYKWGGGGLGSVCTRRELLSRELEM